MMQERLPGYEYFLITHYPHANDYILRQVRASKDLALLSSPAENSTVIMVPEAFLERLGPLDTARKLIQQYESEKNPRTERSKSLLEMDRFFSVNGMSLSELKAITREELKRYIARVCLKPGDAFSDFE